MKEDYVEKKGKLRENKKKEGTGRARTIVGVRREGGGQIFGEMRCAGVVQKERNHSVKMKESRKGTGENELRKK